MSESLFSTSWYRVAELKPCLRSHAQVHRHTYRGQIWYVLQDHSSGRFHRFSPEANLVIGLMDGKRVVREIWDLACARLGDDAPTQDEVINILSLLHKADVLRTDVRPDLQELHERAIRQEKQKFWQYIKNPLALRFPLVDPDRLLNALNPLTRRIFTKGGGLVWLAAMLWAITSVAQHWQELTKDISAQLFAAENLILMALVFPFAKAIHEIGHGFAIKARGGQVHEMGVMLLVLMPIPYVDASASLAFRDKKDRMLVGAAGMLTELTLAMLALLVWVNVEPGLVRALAYNVMIIAGISTLVFNANPLLRFDGYYILADFLEISNLGQRANAHIAYVVKRHILGVKTAEPGLDAPGERPWFVFYAIASFIYRLFISFTIAILVAQQYLILGVLLAMWSLYSSIFLPIGKQLSYLFSSTDLRGTRMRAWLLTLVIFGVIIWFVTMFPVPSWTRTEGVTVAPQDASVRALTDGFVVRVESLAGDTVQAGEPIMEVEDLELLSQVKILQAQLDEQIARYTEAQGQPVQMGLIKEEISHLRSRLQNALERKNNLVIPSPATGTFLLSEAADWPGRFVHRGDLIGYVFNRSALAIQVVVGQGDVDLVRNGTHRVQLRPAHSIERVIQANIRRIVPAATKELPGEALSVRGGGELALDPNPVGVDARSAEMMAASNLFVFELEVDEKEAATFPYVGGRIYVRFELEPEPVGVQVFRVIRRLFLSQFNV